MSEGSEGMKKGIKYKQDQSSIMLLLELNFRQCCCFEGDGQTHNAQIFEHNVSNPNLRWFVVLGCQSNVNFPGKDDPRNKQSVGASSMRCLQMIQNFSLVTGAHETNASRIRRSRIAFVPQILEQNRDCSQSSPIAPRLLSERLEQAKTIWLQGKSICFLGVWNLFRHLPWRKTG